MREKIRQLKDQRFREYTIKIDHIREVYKTSYGSTMYKDKMFCAEIWDMSGGGKMFCEPTLKKLFLSIKHEINL